MTLPPFQRLLDEHASDVHRLLVAAVGRVDADDCFQETFLAALRTYPALRSAENLRGWLLTIAARKAIDRHRARGRLPVPVAAVPEASVTACGPEPADADLWAAVDALPPKQREAVRRRFVDDLPHAAIGRLMGTSTAAARRNVHEGVRRLREER